jgi:hypothetical protein
MRKEPSFVYAVISQRVSWPNELLMYETWRDEPPRPYRAEYERALAELVVSRDVNWFTPLTSWHASLTAPETSPTSLGTEWSTRLVFRSDRASIHIHCDIWRTCEGVRSVKCSFAPVATELPQT